MRRNWKALTLKTSVPNTTSSSFPLFATLMKGEVRAVGMQLLVSIKLSTFRLISCYEDMVQDMSFPKFVEYVLEEATRENCFDSSLGCQINEHIR